MARSFIRPTLFGPRQPRRSLRGAWAQPWPSNQTPMPLGVDLEEDAPEDGFAYGRMNAEWVRVVPLEGGAPQAAMTGPLLAYADPAVDLEVSTKHYADNMDIDGGDY
jgi:hypothetical protein